MFKSVNESITKQVEEFIAKDISDMLDRWQSKDANLIIDKKAFFGILYEDSSRSFKFSVGDQLQIKELAAYVRKIVDHPEPNAGIQHFAPIIREIKKKSNPQQVEQYFGFSRKVNVSNELKPNIDHSILEPPATDLKKNLSQKLFDNVVKLLLKQEVGRSQIERLRCDQILVTMNNDRINGKFPCILCKKSNNSFVAHCSQKNGKYYWTLSNYIQHVKSHLRQRPRKKQHTNSFDIELDNLDQSCPDFFDDEPIDDIEHNINTEEDEFEVLDDENSIHEINEVDDFQNHSIELKIEALPEESAFSDYVSEIYKQISAQMTRMNEAVLIQNEDELDLNFVVADAIRVLKIAEISQDGNCLYGALNHQLHAEKIGSAEYRDSASKMRADVVDHIKLHFEAFEQVLKGVLFNRHNTKTNRNIKKACTEFVEKKLPCEGTWGGSETLTAIIEMKGVNILVINEQGICYFSQKRFDKCLPRTVVLAFRIDTGLEKKKMHNKTEVSNTDRNHYDSVVRIEQNDIFDIAKMLASNECKADAAIAAGPYEGQSIQV